MLATVPAWPAVAVLVVVAGAVLVWLLAVRRYNYCGEREKLSTILAANDRTWGDAALGCSAVSITLAVVVLVIVLVVRRLM